METETHGESPSEIPTVKTTNELWRSNRSDVGKTYFSKNEWWRVVTQIPMIAFDPGLQKKIPVGASVLIENVKNKRRTKWVRENWHYF
jgi:hypothetical protein